MEKESRKTLEIVGSWKAAIVYWLVPSHKPTFYIFLQAPLIVFGKDNFPIEGTYFLDTN